MKLKKIVNALSMSGVIFGYVCLFVLYIPFFAIGVFSFTFLFHILAHWIIILKGNKKMYELSKEIKHIRCVGKENFELCKNFY